MNFDFIYKISLEFVKWSLLSDDVNAPDAIEVTNRAGDQQDDNTKVIDADCDDDVSLRRGTHSPAAINFLAYIKQWRMEIRNSCV